MDRCNNPAGEPCRDWKETLADVLMLFTILLAGVVAGIALRKFCPEFWWFVNWGISV
jgi:hypothetical protein